MESCKNEQLEEIWHIMFTLSDSMFSKPDISKGAKGTYMLSCESVMSAMNTIVSIDFCCQRGFFRMRLRWQESIEMIFFNIYFCLK